jgi:predicted Zn-ribbon and HTH transcriptional regulator
MTHIHDFVKSKKQNGIIYRCHICGYEDIDAWRMGYDYAIVQLTKMTLKCDHACIHEFKHERKNGLSKCVKCNVITGGLRHAGFNHGKSDFIKAILNI